MSLLKPKKSRGRENKEVEEFVLELVYLRLGLNSQKSKYGHVLDYMTLMVAIELFILNLLGCMLVLPLASLRSLFSLMQIDCSFAFFFLLRAVEESLAEELIADEDESLEAENMNECSES